MGNIYLSIQKGWFEKNKVQAEKAYAEGTDEKDDEGFRFDLDTRKETLEVDSGRIIWDFPGRKEEDPFVSLTYELDDEDWIKLSEMLIKRLNKVKAAIEAIQD